MTIVYEELIKPDAEQIAPLRTALQGFNESQLGDYTAATVLISARSASGELQGAVYGWLQFGWLYVSMLWVDPAARRRGVGTTLLRHIERHAQTRGIRRGRLATSDFQPGYDLYRGCGWTVYAEVPIVPDSVTGADTHVEYLMWKHWDA